MLSRAAAYYDRFVESSPTDTTALTVARVRLAQITERLANLNAGSPKIGKDGWRSLTPDADRLTGWKGADGNDAFKYKAGVVTMGRGADLRFPVDTPHVAFRAKITMPQGDAVRIGVRAQAKSEYQVSIRFRSVRLRRYVNTRATDIGVADVSLKAGEQFEIEIIAAGDRLFVRKDGKQIISATDGEFTEAGDILLGTRGSETGWKAEDLKYRPIPKSEVTQLKSK